MNPSTKVLTNLLRAATGGAVVVTFWMIAQYVVSVLAPMSPSQPSSVVNNAEAVQAASLKAEVDVLQLALSPECVFCEQSFDLYRTLALINHSGRFQLQVVFSEEADVVAEYLERRDLVIDKLTRVSDLRDIGLSGIPTIRALDSDGRVIKSWEGLLSPKAQRDLVAVLGLSAEFRAASNVQTQRKLQQGVRAAKLLSVHDLLSLQRSGPMTLIDIRDRNAYSSGHLFGAINIPKDELHLRLPVEVGFDQKVVLMCEYSEVCVRGDKGVGVLGSCMDMSGHLFMLGYRDVSVLNAPVSLLTDFGLQVVKSNLNSLPLMEL